VYSYASWTITIDQSIDLLFKNVNFVIYIADQKATRPIRLKRQSFFCSAMLTPHVLPLVHVRGTLLLNSPSWEVQPWSYKAPYDDMSI